MKPSWHNYTIVLAVVAFSASATFGEAGLMPREIPPEFADAPAVVIEHEVDWDLWMGKSSTRVKKRVLVLRDEGQDHADQTVFYLKPFSKLTAFSARTIQPDGTVVPVRAELQHDLIAYRSGSRELRVVLFTFPAVRAGSILEWEYEIRLDDPLPFEWWEVQETIPVLRAGFEIRFHGFSIETIEIRPRARVPYRELCESGPTKREGRTVALRRYVCRNVPAYEPEPMSPPENESRLRLLMTWWPDTGRSLEMTLWNGIAEEWRKRIRQLSRADGRAQQVVAGLGGNAGSGPLMVDLVYAWVRDHLEVRDFSVEDDLEKGRGASTSVDEILERGGGTANEVAVATLVLLSRAGIDARPVLAGDRASERLDWNFPARPSDLRLLLEVVTDGETGFLDPGCDLCSPGIPDWRFCAGEKSGIRIDLVSGRVTAADVPPIRSKINSMRFRDEIRLDADGMASVQGGVRWFGQYDVTVRRYWEDLTPSGREDSLRSQISGEIEEFTVHLSDPSELGETLEAEYSYARQDMALKTGDRLLIAPPDVFTLNLMLPMQEERNLPLWWPYPYSIVQEAVFTLPEGFEIGELPDATELTGPGLEFKGRWTENRDSGRLRWEAILMSKGISLAAPDYPEARRFATELIRALRRGVVARSSGLAAAETGP